MLLLLDSDMTCDVKRLFSLWTVSSHFAFSKVVSYSMLLSNVYMRVLSQEGTGSGVTPGH